MAAIAYPSAIERFWALVVKTPGCWERGGYRDRFGYTALSPGGCRRTRRVLAHRFSWALHYGPIPKGLCVLHRCDNPPCVRPDHLFLGTRSDNSADKVRKGRQYRGSAHHLSKLSTSDVDLIRWLCEGGFSQKQVARSFGVDPSQVSRIVRFIDRKDG